MSRHSNTRANAARSARPAFTMIEMIVVTSVIALLIALLVPGLGAARRSAGKTTSMANLRQLSIAAEMYAASEQAWPIAIRYDNHGDGLISHAWDWSSYPGGRHEPGTLWTFTDAPDRTLMDPFYHGHDPDAAFADPFTGYNYNTSFIGGEAPFPQIGFSSIRRGVPLGGSRETETTAMFGTAGRRGGTNKFMRAPGNREGLDAGTLVSGVQSFRAGGSSPTVYLDGHTGAPTDSHAGPDAYAEAREQWMDWPRNGFLSDDDDAYDPR